MIRHKQPNPRIAAHQLNVFPNASKTPNAKPAMAKTKSRIQPFLEAVRNARQLIFTVIVIAIFAIAWLVQGGSIDMPEWTKDMRHLEGDDWTKYAVIIIVAVCVVFALMMATGIALLRSDNAHGYS
ncbi:hypothetical protein CEK26_000079 [Fusarium fujikuroi]|nr:hypothetical protein CEK26_000079 [Fusarium fujikuroi]